MIKISLTWIKIICRWSFSFPHKIGEASENIDHADAVRTCGLCGWLMMANRRRLQVWCAFNWDHKQHTLKLSNLETCQLPFSVFTPSDLRWRKRRNPNLTWKIGMQWNYGDSTRQLSKVHLQRKISSYDIKFESELSH